jgi:hypothetical protein
VEAIINQSVPTFFGADRRSSRRSANALDLNLPVQRGEASHAVRNGEGLAERPRGGGFRSEDLSARACAHSELELNHSYDNTGFQQYARFFCQGQFKVPICRLPAVHKTEFGNPAKHVGNAPSPDFSPEVGQIG